MSIWTFKLVVNIKAIYFYPLGIFSVFLMISIYYSYMLHKKNLRHPEKNTLLSHSNKLLFDALFNFLDIKFKLNLLKGIRK